MKQFAELKNSQVETSKNGYGTELSEVIETIENQSIYDVNKLKEFFWQMFIADSFVGNFERHNGNWGFLINEDSKSIEIAPIYDCASCLYPQLTDDMIEDILNNEEEMNFEKIDNIINETPLISDIRKEFYRKILKLRYDIILKSNYERLIKN